ncbi:MAG TPA: SDR family oxidoreductase [Chthoniobacterales bacterium]|jgi:short-subunit dehydrogenase|nr:SDR family oxidoreductase [Chthoniobacterales bacterium]
MSGFDPAGCCALVTGASAGIGWEFARQLTGRAGSLVLVARRREKLEQLRDELTKRDPNLNVHLRATDLSKPDEVHALTDWLTEEKIAIDLLVNNAGLGDQGEFATTDRHRLTEMLAVNVASLTELTHALLPSMIERRRGAILNVSSSAGFFPIPRIAVYAATKAYVTSFSEALRTEVRGYGITVSALCPGPVETEFAEVARRAGKRYRTSPKFTHVSVEAVVQAGLNAVERDKPIVIPGFAMKIAMFLVRLTPMAILRLVSR